MTLTKFKKSVDNYHLVGLSLKSLNNIGLADRAFNLGSDTEVTFDKGRTLVRLGFTTYDNVAKDDAENIISLLKGADLWNDISEDYLIGEVILLDKDPDYEKVTIKGRSIYQYSFKINLDDDGTVAYLLTLTFTEKRYLHGLSLFNGVDLTRTNLDKLIPLVINNAFGEVPTLFRYKARGVVMNLTPSGLTDTVYVTPSNVWLINTTTSRVGIDTEGARGKVTITNTGYVISITLKNKGTLEIFT